MLIVYDISYLYEKSCSLDIIVYWTASETLYWTSKNGFRLARMYLTFCSVGEFYYELYKVENILDIHLRLFVS
ncbi:hypothetical protein PRUPE_1G466800 [Prunus persica]|uniref:Uncharacterized protein n=1 Tax=Prunus persica TaxID=3760 RepID=A0A251RDN2_PRUPE|nr:hypothetical protein PRUPE_1G466800 [Prunus persica]